MPRLIIISLAIALASPAWAGRVAIADFDGPRAEAGALTLLVRSMLQKGEHASVPGRELRKALGGPVHLEVGSAATQKLLDETGADRLVLGSVERDGRHLKVFYRTYDRKLDPTGAGTVSGAAGDLDVIAGDVAQRLAKLVGGEVDAQATATADELQPFVQASGPERAGALRAADPDVARRVAEARAVADELAADANADARDRVDAALAAGEAPRAVEVAQGARTLPPATRARVFLAANDLASARRELKHAPADGDTALARAELALREGHTADGARELAALAPHDGVAARLIATLPPGALGPDEAGVLATAAHAPPAVAARLIARAVKSGVNVTPDAVPFDGLPTRALETVSAALPPSSPAASTVAVLLKERASDKPRVVEETAPPVVPGSAQPAPVAAAPVAAAAPKPAVHRTVAPEVAALADELEPLLDVFPALGAHADATVRVARLRHARGFSARLVDEELLAAALAEALQRDARKLKAVRVGDAASVEALADAGAELAVAFEARAKGDRAEVQLFVREQAAGKTQHEQLLVASRRTGLVSLNLVFWVIVLGGIGGLLAGAGILAWRIAHVGHVRVDLRNQLGSEKDTLAIRLSRSATAPAVDDLAAFDRRERRRGPRTMFGHRSLAAGVTEFHRVQPGEWYVHLYGVFVREGELQKLPPLSRLVNVRTGQTERVFFELTRDAGQVRVVVTDGRPLKGARVYVGHEELQTGDGGDVRVLLPAGEHLVRIEARGVLAERQVTVASAASYDVAVDLIAERNRTRETTDAAS